MPLRRAVATLLLAQAAAVALVPASTTTGAERLLVGAYVHDAEAGSLEVLRENGVFLLPLRAFSEIAGCRLESEDDVPRLATPLGTVPIDPSRLHLVEGVLYFEQPALEDALGARVRFDRQEYALRFDLPWGGDSPVAPAPGPLREADVGPPGLSLSTVHQDLFYTRRDDNGDVFSSTSLGGSLEGGFWRLRVDDDLDGSRRVQDYAWYRTHGNLLYLAGRQDIRLHPLLNGFQLTGGQVAWTNQPLDLFPRSLEARELLPRRVQPAATFRGSAPPGSLVQLRIDGVIVDDQRVGLDGRYEFLEVRLASRQVSEAAVLVFDRDNPTAPVEIHEKRLSNSEYLLQPGARIHLGGLGREGNLADDLMYADREDRLAGFYQGRYGLSERLTLETGVQGTAGNTQVLAGFTARLAPGVVASLGLGAAGGRVGYDLDLDGGGRRWRLAARSRMTPDGFVADGARATFDHAAEAWYERGSWFELGLLGRLREDTASRTRFILPAVSLRPAHRLVVQARPGSDGDYRGYLNYAPTRSDRVIASIEERAVLEYSHTFGRRYRVGLATEGGGGRPARYSAVLSRLAGGWQGMSWSVGALSRGGDPGLQAGANLPLVPGVLARMSYETFPAGLTGDGEPGRQLTAGLTVDLALAGRRLMPARGGLTAVDRGAVVGRVQVQDDPTRVRDDLEGLTILVDGKAASRTDRRGNFFLGNLREGTYLIELEAENLPLELALQRSATVARVAPGASTRVDFEVRPEYGIAGRVVDLRGRPRPATRVELVDAAGDAVATGVTDRFGLYRLDGIPAGRYTLRPGPGAVPPGVDPPSRELEILEDFLFDQDLQVPGVDVPAPATDPVKRAAS